MRTRPYSSTQGPAAGCCGHGNQRADSTMAEEVLDKLSDYQFLKKGSALWTKLACTFTQQVEQTLSIPLGTHVFAFIAGDGKCVQFRSVRQRYHEVMCNTADICDARSTSRVSGDYITLVAHSKQKARVHLISALIKHDFLYMFTFRF